jgi:hypothetical protein
MRANVPMVINFVLVPERREIAVNVNDIFSVQRYTVSSLVLLADTFWEQPVQNREVNMHGLEFPAVILQVLLR